MTRLIAIAGWVATLVTLRALIHQRRVAAFAIEQAMEPWEEMSKRDLDDQAIQREGFNQGMQWAQDWAAASAREEAEAAARGGEAVA